MISGLRARSNGSIPVGHDSGHFSNLSCYSAQFGVSFSVIYPVQLFISQFILLAGLFLPPSFCTLIFIVTI